MDLSKAYDSLAIDLLIAKLTAYGFGSTSLALITDYLTNRLQRVKIQSTFSSYLTILRGIPQESILGSILFNLFVSDVKEAEVCNFADETTIYSSRTYFYKTHKQFMQYSKEPFVSFDKNTKTFILGPNKTSF